MKDFEYILSDNIFVNKKYVNKTLNTLASDTIDDGSIQYDMNEHGYRSPNFNKKSNYNILTLGCSWTMGIGVDNANSWPNIIGKLIDDSATVFNYATYGASPSFISKNFYKIVTSEIKPNLVMIMWPGFSRRDYLKEDGTFKKIGGFRMANDTDLVWKNDDEDILFVQLRNDYQDLMEFWESYKMVELTSKLYNIKTYHTIAGYYYEVFKSLEHILNNTIDYSTFFDPSSCYKNDFKGRDNHHPGNDWHNTFAKEFYTYIKNRL